MKDLIYFVGFAWLPSFADTTKLPRRRFRGVAVAPMFAALNYLALLAAFAHLLERLNGAPNRPVCAVALYLRAGRNYGDRNLMRRPGRQSSSSL